MDTGALTAIVAKASVQLSTWLALQDAVGLLAGNAGNLCERLPAVQSARNYEGFPQPDELQKLVLAQTLTAFDNVLRRLRDKLKEMAEVVRAQEKLCVQAWEALGSTASASACGQTQLTTACTPAQMVEAVEDAWYMCRDELCLKASVLAQLQAPMPPEEFASIQEFLQSNVHVRPESSSVLLLQNWVA